MGRDEKSRNTKAGGAPLASRGKGTVPPKGPSRKKAPPRRSMGSRVGLRKKGEPVGQPTPQKGARPANAPRQPDPAYERKGQTGQLDRQTGQLDRQTGRPGPRPVANPQQAGYRQGTPRPNRRMTKSEKKRQILRRRMIGLAAVAAALVAGVILSINLLFKVTDFRVENTDRTVPANTGIYTEQQIIDLLGVSVGDNLFAFSTRQKAAALAAQLPYLDEIKVQVAMPGAVIIRVRPATERYGLPLGDKWLVLSDGMKVLKINDAWPDGLIWLDAQPADSQPAVGSILTLGAGSTAIATPEDADSTTATAEEALYDANSALTALRASMEQYGVLDSVTYISLMDLSEISFLYQGRVSVKLGTVNNLDYKMRLASNALLDADGTGISESEHGTLDVSYQQTNGEIRGYFQLADPQSE